MFRSKSTRLGLIVLVSLGLGLALWLILQPDQGWRLEEITIPASDGFPLPAYLAKPRKPDGTRLPAVVCFHQLWGNRDDYLALVPELTRRGLVVIVPDLPRQKSNLDRKRIEDLGDVIDYAARQPYIDGERLGIVTASFSVENGLSVITSRPGVKADVMLSGPITQNRMRTWITDHSDLAVFTITSLQDGANPYLLEEVAARSLHPLSRTWIIDAKENPFAIQAHGTFVFDEYPESLWRIGEFFTQVLTPDPMQGGTPNTDLLKEMVTFRALDGLPIAATLAKAKQANSPALILYPPEFMNRRHYNALVQRLSQMGITVLAPNTKRTCRRDETAVLCRQEVNGAIRYLRGLPDKWVDPQRIGVLFPSFYFLSAMDLKDNRLLECSTLFLMETPGLTRFNADSLQSDERYRVFRVRDDDPDRLALQLIRKLKQ